MTMQAPSNPDAYTADYYGMSPTPKANYRNYGPQSIPHWSMPLAVWITSHAIGPVLDCGCAFGHLVRDLNKLGMEAHGIEWSEYATSRRVHRNVIQGNALEAHKYFGVMRFGVITSLDFLEHFYTFDTARMIGIMHHLMRPTGMMIHLIGAHNPKDDLSHHLSDPTHMNHEPLEWYHTVFEMAGWQVNAELTDDLRQNNAWRDTDWNGRFFVYTR